jgi:hypothetical protein
MHVNNLEIENALSFIRNCESVNPAKKDYKTICSQN